MQVLLFNLITTYIVTLTFDMKKNKKLQFIMTDIENCQIIALDFFDAKKEILYLRYKKIAKLIKKTILRLLTKKTAYQYQHKIIDIFKQFSVLSGIYIHFMFYYKLIKYRNNSHIRAPNFIVFCN